MYKQIRQGLVGSMLNVLGADATRKAQQLAVEEAGCNPDAVRVRRDPRLPDDLPDPARRGRELGPGARSSGPRGSRRPRRRGRGLHWTFAPMVDIARDARWGRIIEGAGEDPYLGAQIAAARVRGFQGRDLAAPDALAACAKHFAGYGFAAGGRDYNTVDISENDACATSCCRPSRPRSTPASPRS